MPADEPAPGEPLPADPGKRCRSRPAERSQPLLEVASQLESGQAPQADTAAIISRAHALAASREPSAVRSQAEEGTLAGTPKVEHSSPAEAGHEAPAANEASDGAAAPAQIESLNARLRAIAQGENAVLVDLHTALSSDIAGYTNTEETLGISCTSASSCAKSHAGSSGAW